MMAKPPSRQGSPDEFQTPHKAVQPLLPYIPIDWIVWECACGRGNLSSFMTVLGWRVIESDILTGQDFIEWQPDKWDCIITNPPYRYKQEFLERAYSLKKPFAFLMPLTTLETRKRQRLFDKHGVEILFLPDRVNFETPSGNGSGAWFATAWFTWGLDIGKQLTFTGLNND